MARFDHSPPSSLILHDPHPTAPNNIFQGTGKGRIWLYIHSYVLLNHFKPFFPWCKINIYITEWMTVLMAIKEIFPNRGVTSIYSLISLENWLFSLGYLFIWIAQLVLYWLSAHTPNHFYGHGTETAQSMAFRITANGRFNTAAYIASL